MIGRRWTHEDYEGPVDALAQRLLGRHLSVRGAGGTIVETEAYHQSEPACHAAKGRRPRCEVLFWRPGHLYVYRIHQVFCLNITAEADGVGAAVLIRAIEPTAGIDLIEKRRAGRAPQDWSNGPGKICQALDVDLSDNGADLLTSENIFVSEGRGSGGRRVLSTPRIGISQARELPWRFLLAPSASPGRRPSPTPASKKSSP